MDIDIVGAAVAPRTDLEEDLATVFRALLEDASTAHESICSIYNICLGRVETLRAEAAEQLHRPSHHMALKAQAEELEAQAATWLLLFCLYCDPSEAAGRGGNHVEGAGDASLYRQRLADAIGTDKELERCARVVAWLESLADDCLKRQGRTTFAPGEGLWCETKTEMRARPDAMVSELDPDAPGRSGRSLHPSNARSQERILARVWQFMRAGKMQGAHELCRNVGQSWRAAALCGGGVLGALPVGLTALEYDAKVSSDVQVEELADEVMNGSGTMLALWRWAAHQAAAAPPGDKFERAVFGALGGNTAAATAACSTWEDFAWVYCRSWLEAQALRVVPPQPQSPGDLVAGDLVTAALRRCGVAPATAQRCVEGAMSVVMGTGGDFSDAATAIAATSGIDADMSSTRSFGQLFSQSVMSPAALATSGPPAVQALRQVQGLLVQGDVHALADHLFTSLVDRRSGGVAAGRVGMDGAGRDEGALFDSDSSTVFNTDSYRRMCALAVHMLLSLGGIGAVPWKQLAATDLGANTLDLIQRLVGYYTGMLLEQSHLELVPPYLCMLRPKLRSAMCRELLDMHTKRLTGMASTETDAADESCKLAALVEADEACYHAVQSLEYWFRRCVERQRKPDAARSSRLETDIKPDEFRIQLTTFTRACLRNREYGPHQRARVARWLALPHIIAVQAAMEAALGDEGGDSDAEGGGGGEAGTIARVAAITAARLDPWIYYDVMEYANGLCCKFALGDDVTAAAAHRLFEEVLPEGLEQAANAAADSLHAGAVAGASVGVPSYLHEDDQGASLALDPEAAEQLAAQLKDLAAEMASWRLYFHLDSKVAAWLARHEAHQEKKAKADETLIQDGGDLMQEFLLHLLEGGWQQTLATAERAVAAAAASDSVVRITLAVTCPPHSSFGGSSGSMWGQPTAPYPELQGAAMLEFQQVVDTGLRRAAAERGLSAELTVSAVPVPQAHGHVTVSLAVAAEPQLWRDLVELVCDLVRGELEGIPSLLVVDMEADRATSLAVCRRCCIGQAVIRCTGLRLSLVRLGADAEAPMTGPQLFELLAAPEEPSMGMGLESGLLDVLGNPLLAKVLLAEANTYQQHLDNLQQHRKQQQHMRW